MYEAETLLIGRDDAPSSAFHPDMEIAINICIDDPDHIYIFHDQAFRHELSWIEYDCANGRLDFVMEDGDIRNFGIAVEPQIGHYFNGNHDICVALTNYKRVLSHIVIPLVTHH